MFTYLRISNNRATHDANVYIIFIPVGKGKEER